MEWWPAQVTPVIVETIEPLMERMKQAHSLEPTAARRVVSPSLTAPKQRQVTLQLVPSAQRAGPAWR